VEGNREERGEEKEVKKAKVTKHPISNRKIIYDMGECKTKDG
jgi:hypothetical protein